MQGRTTSTEHDYIRRVEFIRNRLRQLVAGARWVLAAGRGHSERGRLLRDVMRLDVVAGGGHTPNSYGWHVDGLLNVGVHYPNDPMAASEEPPADTRGLPKRISEPSVYHVPRTARRQLRLRLGAA